MPLGDPAASLFSLLRGAVAPALIAGWRRRGVDRPLPMQRRLLRETEFLSGQNLLLIAPTSAGKTLIGEIALARAMTLGRKGVYLVPTKALAEERLADFTAWLAPAGRRVLCATRDRPESDAPARRGEFDVLIAVYEKFNHLTVARPQSLAAVGAVVVDEIQSIDDAERGATLDLLLTRLRLSPYRPQLVALGAREAGARRLAAWLECELFVDRRRPRELRSGVLDAVGGEFRYVESTNEAESRERLAPPGAIDDLAARLIDRRPERAAPPDPWARSMLAAAAHRVSLGERALVFAPTRAAARHWAQALAALDPAAPAAGALAAIARAEPGQARDRLAEALERGVAFHNADLEPAARAAIERAFNEGEVRAIVSTPTLASGVNLAADAVFHFPWRVIGEGSAGPPVAVSLGAERFAQQGGRAARLGLGEGPGRSILVAAGPAEAERLWSEFIADPPAEPLAAPLAGRPLVSVAVDLLAGGVRRTAANLFAACAETYSARCTADGARGFDLSPESVDEALIEAERLNLIRRDPASGFCALSGLGEVAAGQVLLPETVAALRSIPLDRLAGADAPDRATLVDLFARLALTAEGRIEAVRLGGGSAPISPGDEEGLDDATLEIAMRFFEKPGGPTRGEVAALRASLALADWTLGESNESIERRFDVAVGAVARAADRFAWLAGAPADLAELGRAERATVRRARRLAERIERGLPESALAAARLRVAELGRTPLIGLAAAGVDSLQAILEADRARLVDLIGPESADALQAAACAETARRERAFKKRFKAAKPRFESDASDKSDGSDKSDESNESDESDSVVVLLSPTASTPSTPDLEIDLQSPGIIRAAGREVALPGLAFDLLAALAERPGKVFDYDALHLRLWPDGDGPEQQQIHQHRRNLMRRLAPAWGRDVAAIEAVRGMGLRLALAPERVILKR